MKTTARASEIEPVKKTEHHVGYDHAGEDLTCPMQAVKSIVEDTDLANRHDIQWMSQRLQDLRQANPLKDHLLVQGIRQKLLQDRDIVRIAKESWGERGERDSHWLNMHRLTSEDPFWGNYESALELLDCYESLPFTLFSANLNLDSSSSNVDYPLSHIGPCFEKACKSRVYTVYKHVLFHALYVVTFVWAGEEKKESDDILLRVRLFQQVLKHTQFIYPMPVPSNIKEMLTDCCLYNSSSAVLLIPNSGYVYGGLVQETMPFNRGLDCTSFTGWVTGCGRPLTYLYEWVCRMKLGELPPEKEDIPMVSMLCARHDIVEACEYNKLQLGDILVWRHVDGGGHAMFVQKMDNDDHILTVECTNYKDGLYEGFQARVVPIENPHEGGGQFVLRPKHQHVYHTFRQRSQQETLLKL